MKIVGLMLILFGIFTLIIAADNKKRDTQRTNGKYLLNDYTTLV